VIEALIGTPHVLIQSIRPVLASGDVLVQVFHALVGIGKPVVDFAQTPVRCINTVPDVCDTSVDFRTVLLSSICAFVEGGEMSIETLVGRYPSFIEFDDSPRGLRCVLFERCKALAVARHAPGNLLEPGLKAGLSLVGVCVQIFGPRDAVRCRFDGRACHLHPFANLDRLGCVFIARGCEFLQPASLHLHVRNELIELVLHPRIRFREQVYQVNDRAVKTALLPEEAAQEFRDRASDGGTLARFGHEVPCFGGIKNLRLQMHRQRNWRHGDGQ
jgi:hypothetical protein